MLDTPNSKTGSRALILILVSLIAAVILVLSVSLFIISESNVRRMMGDVKHEEPVSALIEMKKILAEDPDAWKQSGLGTHLQFSSNYFDVYVSSEYMYCFLEDEIKERIIFSAWSTYDGNLAGTLDTGIVTVSCWVIPEDLRKRYIKDEHGNLIVK